MRLKKKYTPHKIDSHLLESNLHALCPIFAFFTAFLRETMEQLTVVQCCNGSVTESIEGLLPSRAKCRRSTLKCSSSGSGGRRRRSHATAAKDPSSLSSTSSHSRHSSSSSGRRCGGQQQNLHPNKRTPPPRTSSSSSGYSATSLGSLESLDSFTSSLSSSGGGGNGRQDRMLLKMVQSLSIEARQDLAVRAVAQMPKLVTKHNLMEA